MMSSSTSSSDDSSYSETEYPTINLNSQGKIKRSSSYVIDERLKQEMKKQKLSQEKLAEHIPDGIKIYKPEECMKYMNVEIHQNLFQMLNLFELADDLLELGAHLLFPSENLDTGLVLWSRVISKKFVRDGDQVKTVPVKQPCDTALYVISAEEVADLVKNETLSEFITEKKRMARASLSLAIYGVSGYFKSASRKANTKTFKKNVMTEADLEMAIADVLVNTDCDVIKVNSINDLMALLMRFTKAIAEAPYKNAKRTLDDRAAFYMQGDNRNCISVNKDGTGSDRLWQQMLAVLPSSSLEIARAIIDKYKTPRELIAALSKQDGVNELADIGVVRSEAPDAKPRRIGLELAKKLGLLFTSQQGNSYVC